MKLLFCLVLLYSLISFAQGQNCSAFTSCKDCTLNNTGCGWCAPTQSCVAGNGTGPAVGKCLGYTSWEYGQCTVCESLKDCRQCRGRNTDCGWCGLTASTGYCYDLDVKQNSSRCLMGHTCPCTVYATCGECRHDPLCHFCAGEQQCKRVTTQCSQPGPNIFNNMTCPCNLTQSCEMCRAAPGCNWCQDLGCTDVGADVDCNATTNCNSWCNTFNNCPDCQNTDGCEWTANKQCVDPDIVHDPIAHTCVECSFLSYCDTCNAEPDCAWCSETGNCHPKKGSPCNQWAFGCDGYCAKFTNCDQCNVIKGCGWCDDLGECHSVQLTQCLFAHSCAEASCPKCGFDGGSFVGGMFLPIGVALLAYAGYKFYMWRTGSKASYTELR